MILSPKSDALKKHKNTTVARVQAKLMNQKDFNLSLKR